MKRFTAILFVILLLCLTFAACGEKSDSNAEKATEAPTAAPEPGVKVGDSFDYSGFKLIVAGITEGSEGFDDPGSPEGKFVTINFDADTSDWEGGSYSADKTKFAIDGKQAVDAQATMSLMNGSLSPSGMTVLFDVDKDAGLDYLHLTVSE